MANKFIVDADAFRFYEDDGSPSESASTPIDAQDVNVTRNLVADNQLHLRYRVQEIGAGSVPGETTDDYTIEFRINEGGSWIPVTTSSSRVRVDLNSLLTDGGATTDRSTDGISAGSGSFFAGEQEEGDGEITDFQHEADNYTEHVWGLELVSLDWSGGDFVDLRMRLNGGAMDNSVTPRITAFVAPLESGFLAAYIRRSGLLGIIGR